MGNKTISGTLEWAVANVNNTKGCIHQCRYCYARARALRFKQIETPEDWGTVEVRHVRPRKLYNGTVMFPTTHDIFPLNLGACIETLTSLVQAGNKVLIVSKPSPPIIQELISMLKPWKDQVLFRFTIGTLDSEVSRLWEPGAPDPSDRVMALERTTKAGWATSVSMEPMLTPLTAVEQALRLHQITSNTIWLGRMNQISRRVVGVPKEDVDRLDIQQRAEVIWKIYHALKDYGWVRWKESIKKIVGLPLETEAGTDR